MRLFILSAAVLLSGCATSAQGLYETDVEAVVLSDKSPQVFATCAVERFAGSNALRSDGTRYWVVRNNTWGVPIVRWDFTPTPTGSRAELRASISVGTGKDKIESCA